MYFMDDYPYRELERLMQRIPNFEPRGHGAVILNRHEYTAKDCDCSVCPYHKGRKSSLRCKLPKCICLEERITAGCATMRETLTETMSAIRYPPFQKRLDQYIEESGETPMDYRNEKHRNTFTEAIKRLDRKDYALLSAIYLLTAEHALWKAAKDKTSGGRLDFEQIKPSACSTNGYALFCAAKDLYLGTDNLTIHDLSAVKIVPPKIFALICNAMAIRRFGLGAINQRKGEEKL